MWYEHAEEGRILHAQDAHKPYIHGTEKRRVVVAIGVSVVVFIEGDSCVKKEESVAAELNRRGTM